MFSFRIAASALVLAAGASLSACDNTATQETAAVQPEAATAEAVKAPIIHIDNFTLADEAGQEHTLYDLKDAPAVVLVMHGNGCPIVQRLTPTLKEAAAAYRPKGVKFFMINSNSQDTPEAIAKEVDKYELGIHVLKDADQTLGHELGAERTAEVFVVDPKTWDVVFHGPIDDRLTYGLEKPRPEKFYLNDTLDAMLAGQPVPQIEAKADGCIINYIEPDKA
ncbi:MAG: redoxin domain-containing protein [Hyphomonadaceae bacterium]